MPLFELSQINYYYPGKIIALKDISLTIEKGDQLAIIGANGCGKSTLLKVMAGLIPQSSGHIKVFDHELSEPLLNGSDGGKFAQFFRSRLGILFQNSDLQLFCPTVFDEIAFGPLQLEIPREEVIQRVQDVMNMLEITHLKNRAPHALSGGEKKRVAIASVLSLNPDVLLLDEPTNGLDPRTQGWFEELLHNLITIGKTIIIATHDLDIVDAITDNVVVLGEDHQIAKIGPTKEILADHDVLLKVNLIHEHLHKHGELWHKHGEEPYRHSHSKEK